MINLIIQNQERVCDINKSLSSEEAFNNKNIKQDLIVICLISFVSSQVLGLILIMC